MGISLASEGLSLVSPRHFSRCGEFRSRGPFGLQSSYCLRQHMQGAFYVSKLSFELIVSGGGWGGGLGGYAQNELEGGVCVELYEGSS
jgi:hypothetical protein